MWPSQVEIHPADRVYRLIKTLGIVDQRFELAGQVKLAAFLRCGRVFVLDMDHVQSNADKAKNAGHSQRLELREQQQPFANALPLKLFVRRQLTDEGNRIFSARKLFRVWKGGAVHGLHRERNVAQDARCADLLDRDMSYAHMFRGVLASRLPQKYVHLFNAAVERFPVVVRVQWFNYQW